ncbi:MAG: histidine phosphatase family protein [SAR202 cluster bacterium]|nr:histidine phosphatase family protein [SAR202 cluster bacterium]
MRSPNSSWPRRWKLADLSPANGRTLTLVKHSLPIVDPDLPPSRWELSHEGRRRCTTLADRISQFDPVAIHASVEPKATETAKIVAQRLDVPLSVREGLEEHHRDDVPFFRDPSDFDDAIARLFEAPDDLVYGAETANQALTRFERALLTIIDSQPNSNTVVVSHGTVIALYLARHCGIDPLGVWRSLGLPSYAVLALPGPELLDIVTDIT